MRLEWAGPGLYVGRLRNEYIVEDPDGATLYTQNLFARIIVIHVHVTEKARP